MITVVITNDVTPAMTLANADERRVRRFVDDDDERCVGRVSLIHLFLALHNDSVHSPPATTTADPMTTDSKVATAPATLSLAEQVSQRFGQSVLLGLLPTVAIFGLVANGLVMAPTGGDARCPASWRVLRCCAVIVDVLLLTLLLVVVDVAAVFAITSLDVLNMEKNPSYFPPYHFAIFRAIECASQLFGKLRHVAGRAQRAGRRGWIPAVRAAVDTLHHRYVRPSSAARRAAQSSSST